MNYVPKYSIERQNKRQSQKIVTAINSKEFDEELIKKIKNRISRDLSHQVREAMYDIHL